MTQMQIKRHTKCCYQSCTTISTNQFLSIFNWLIVLFTWCVWFLLLQVWLNWCILLIEICHILNEDQRAFKTTDVTEVNTQCSSSIYTIDKKYGHRPTSFWCIWGWDKGHSHIMPCNRVGAFTFCDKGWVGCFWSTIPHFKTTWYLAHLASK